MAKKKVKTETLEEWAGHFPDLVSWKNQYLIRRDGGLLSGICLDELRDPSAYKPTFFFHNLLAPSRGMTLAYASPLLSRSVYKPVKYSDSGESISEFKNQMPIHQAPTLKSFIAHACAVDAGKYGPQVIYVPHFFRDVITLGSDQETYYVDAIERCAEVIETMPDINLNIITSVAEWESNVRYYTSIDTESLIMKQTKELGLPELNDNGLHVEVIEEFWELIKYGK